MATCPHSYGARGTCSCWTGWVINIYIHTPSSYTPSPVQLFLFVLVRLLLGRPLDSAVHCIVFVFTGGLIWLHTVRVYFRSFLLFFSTSCSHFPLKSLTFCLPQTLFPGWQFFTSGLVFIFYTDNVPLKEASSVRSPSTDPAGRIYVKHSTLRLRLIFKMAIQKINPLYMMYNK